MPSLDFKNPRRTGGAPGTTLFGAGKYVLLLTLFALSSLYYLAGTAPETTESETANETVVETAANLGLAPTLPLLPEHETVTGEIARGEAFSEALKTAGIPHEAVFELVKALRKGIQRADFNQHNTEC